MERLTKRVGNHFCYAEACKDCARDSNSCNDCGIRTLINRLGELEDKLENGKLIELIAPLDSELWEIECPKHKDHKGNIWTSLTYKDAKVVKSKYKLSLSNYDMLLKGYYFLTEKQAEARLQELRGEK